MTRYDPHEAYALKAAVLHDDGDPRNHERLLQEAHEYFDDWNLDEDEEYIRELAADGLDPEEWDRTRHALWDEWVEKNPEEPSDDMSDERYREVISEIEEKVDALSAVIQGMAREMIAELDAGDA